MRSSRRTAPSFLLLSVHQRIPWFVPPSFVLLYFGFGFVFSRMFCTQLVVLLCTCCALDLLAGQLHHSRSGQFSKESHDLFLPIIPCIVMSFDLVVLLSVCCVCDLLAGQLHHSCSCQFTKKSHDIISFSLYLNVCCGGPVRRNPYFRRSCSSFDPS